MNWYFLLWAEVSPYSDIARAPWCFRSPATWLFDSFFQANNKEIIRLFRIILKVVRVSFSCRWITLRKNLHKVTSSCVHDVRHLREPDWWCVWWHDERHFDDRLTSLWMVTAALAPNWYQAIRNQHTDWKLTPGFAVTHLWYYVSKISRFRCCSHVVACQHTSIESSWFIFHYVITVAKEHQWLVRINLKNALLLGQAFQGWVAVLAQWHLVPRRVQLM